MSKLDKVLNKVSGVFMAVCVICAILFCSTDINADLPWSLLIVSAGSGLIAFLLQIAIREN